MYYLYRLWVVPHFSSGIVERVKRERAWKSPHARKGDMRRGERKMVDYRQSPSSLSATCRLFSRGVIFTPTRVSLALLSLRKTGGLLVVYYLEEIAFYSYLNTIFTNSHSSNRKRFLYATSKTSWRHNHVYILSWKHASQPIRACIIS